MFEGNNFYNYNYYSNPVDEDVMNNGGRDDG